MLSERTVNNHQRRAEERHVPIQWDCRHTETATKLDKRGSECVCRYVRGCPAQPSVALTTLLEELVYTTDVIMKARKRNSLGQNYLKEQHGDNARRRLLYVSSISSTTRSGPFFFIEQLPHNKWHYETELIEYFFTGVELRFGNAFGRTRSKGRLRISIYEERKHFPLSEPTLIFPKSVWIEVTYRLENRGARVGEANEQMLFTL